MTKRGNGEPRNTGLLLLTLLSYSPYSRGCVLAHRRDNRRNSLHGERVCQSLNCSKELLICTFTLRPIVRSASRVLTSMLRIFSATVWEEHSSRTIRRLR